MPRHSAACVCCPRAQRLRSTHSDFCRTLSPPCCTRVYAVMAEDGRVAELCEAARAGSVVTMEALLAAGADVDGFASVNGWACPMFALGLAAKAGHTLAVQALLRAGANVNLANRYGATALMCASTADMTQVMPILLDGGADVNRTTAAGLTALHTATAKARVEPVEILLLAGARMDLRDNRGRRADEGVSAPRVACARCNDGVAD
jgi:hypothetical protein